MSSVPRQSWKDVRELIHGWILNSTYRPGDKLPRDEDIAQTLGCARSTVQRAMQSLAADGIIYRRRKGGTAITSNPVTRTTLDIPITRLEIEGRGHQYSYHLISRNQCVAPQSVLARLGLDETNAVLRVQALHLADGRPYVYEDRWISLDTVPEIKQVDLTKTSANEWLVRNRPFSRCNVQIYANSIGGEEARFMEAADGMAMLVLERTTWIDEGPITYVQATHAPGYRLVTNS